MFRRDEALQRSKSCYTAPISGFLVGCYTPSQATACGAPEDEGYVEQQARVAQRAKQIEMRKSIDAWGENNSHVQKLVVSTI